MSRIVLFFVSLFALANAYSATQITLDVGVTDSERYGNKMTAPFTRITDELQTSFVLDTDGQTYLSIVGFDIDFPNEVSIVLDGGGTMFLDAVKVNNGFSPVSLIDLGILSSGNHTLVIKNAQNRDYKWGVTDLLITHDGDDNGGSGSGVAFELLTELGCEVGQIIRATALGWECVDEYSCPSYFASLINGAMISNPSGGGDVIDGCSINSDIFDLYFDSGEGDLLDPPPFISVEQPDSLEFYGADFIRHGEFYACLKLVVDDAGNELCDY